MKKLFLLLGLVFLTISANAEILRLRATSYAFGNRDKNGAIVWGEWESSNVVITVDEDNDFIKVYSNREQNYVIVKDYEENKENDGSVCLVFDAIDEEGIECTIKFRMLTDGTAQMYAYYNNIAWVYGNIVSL